MVWSIWFYFDSYDCCLVLFFCVCLTFCFVFCFLCYLFRFVVLISFASLSFFCCDVFCCLVLTLIFASRVNQPPAPHSSVIFPSTENQSQEAPDVAELRDAEVSSQAPCLGNVRAVPRSKCTAADLCCVC